MNSYSVRNVCKLHNLHPLRCGNQITILTYSLRRSPEKSARAKELANVNESQKSRAPATPGEQILDSFASSDWGGSGNNTTESLYEMNFRASIPISK
jgi:hypothetical protein